MTCQRVARTGPVPLLCAAVAACGASPGPATVDVEEWDWRTEWEVPPGYTVDVDAGGFHLPTAIALVPEPGPDPMDPLYFVTEIRGAVRVVTNDRSVHTFAEDFFRLEVERELPSARGEAGLAGICLDPEHGYVFVTYAYEDEGGVLRNDVRRFDTRPGTFAVRPAASRAFTDVFRAHPSGVTHQIGACQVVDGLLYVGVGDAWRPQLAQVIESMAGKVVRMTLDGEPVPDNPFFDESHGAPSAANYVWAYGLRNPFGMKAVDGRLFVADNGDAIDRFMEVHEGVNYFWNGSDAGIATNAAFVFYPALAPVQLDYHAGSGPFPEAYAGSFFVAIAAAGFRNTDPGIMVLPFDVAAGRMREVPSYFVRYRGPGPQIVSGLAFGPDGLYFVPILPDRAGESAVYRIRYAGEADGTAHPAVAAADIDGRRLLEQRGCLGCHLLDGDPRWREGGAAAPPLGRSALLSRARDHLRSAEYLHTLDQLDTIDEEPFVSFAGARQAVREADGIDQVRTWVTYRIMEPRFDQRDSRMPNLGLSMAEAAAIADFLLAADAGSGAGLRRRATALLDRVAPQRAGRRHLALFGLSGFLMGGFFAGAAALALVHRGRRRAAGGAAGPAGHA